MTLLYKWIVEYSGWSGGPGVNVLYMTEGSIPGDTQNAAQQMYDELHGAYSAHVGLWRPDVKVIVGRECAILEHSTGKIVNVQAVAQPKADIVSTGIGGGESPATMALARFVTDRWLNGRRLKGRSFLGPINASALDANGRMKQVLASTIEDSYTSMTSGVGVRLAVYSRPSPANSMVGNYADVVTVAVDQKAAILRSRRD